jgi:hypothetical protein
VSASIVGVVVGVKLMLVAPLVNADRVHAVMSKCMSCSTYFWSEAMYYSVDVNFCSIESLDY